MASRHIPQLINSRFLVGYTEVVRHRFSVRGVAAYAIVVVFFAGRQGELSLRTQVGQLPG